MKNILRSAPQSHMNTGKMSFMIFTLVFSLFSAGFSEARAAESTAAIEPSGQVLFLYRLSQPDGFRVTSSNPDGVGLQSAYFGARGNAGSDFFDLNTNLGVERASGTISTYSVTVDEAFVDMGPIHKFKLRVGKFRQRFGTSNQKRVNQAAFIDRPLIYQEAFGSALNELSLAFVYRMSFFPWVSEFSEQFFTPSNTTLFGGTSNATNLGGVFYWRNEFPVSNVSQLVLDLGSVYGTNTYGSGSHVYEIGLTFQTERFKWVNDYLFILKEGASVNKREGGLTTFAQYEFSPRWWLQGRYDYVGLPVPDTGARQQVSALVAHTPSKNAAIRFEYDYQIEPTGNFHRGQIQLVVGIGSGPAHGYSL